MNIKNRKRILAGALVQVLAAGSWLAASQLAANAAPWSTGDVFVAISNGQYQQFSSAGLPLETLQAGTLNFPLPGSEPPIFSGGFTGACAFNPEGFPAGPQNLYTTLWSENKIVVMSPTDPHPVLATIDTTLSGGTGHPESIAFNSAGDFYVGLVDGTGPNLLKYSRTHPASGATPIATYTLATGVRGVDAISLTANQDFIYYTSEDGVIRTYNVATPGGAQGPNFTTNVPLSTAFGLRLLQGGNPFGGSGLGFLMVADYNYNFVTDVETAVIRVFNQAGQQVNTYDAPNHDGWFSLSIKSGGAEFVAGDFRNGNIQTFNAAGPTTSFNASAIPFRVNGACVRGEVTPGVVPFPAIGFFIVGDVSAGFDGSFAVGNTVYFWGNDWAVNNTLSGPNNSNKSAFKGFAEKTFPPTPYCAVPGPPPVPAGTFESGGGASSAPPLTLPDQVAVIVTSTMSKSGDIKASGAIRAILLVQVNQGTYNNSSGGVGTGTVVQLVCGS